MDSSHHQPNSTVFFKLDRRISSESRAIEKSCRQPGFSPVAPPEENRRFFSGRQQRSRKMRAADASLVSCLGFRGERMSLVKHVFQFRNLPPSLPRPSHSCSNHYWNIFIIVAECRKTCINNKRIVRATESSSAVAEFSGDYRTSCVMARGFLLRGPNTARYTTTAGDEDQRTEDDPLLRDLVVAVPSCFPFLVPP